MKHLFAATLAVALLAPATMKAHEGHDHKIMGVVTVIHENHLEVKDAKGNVTKHVIGATTKIRKEKAKAGVGDIKVGDRVVVTTRETKDKDGKVVVNVLDVQIGAAANTATKDSAKK
jgi:putative aminopeptidase FrvX